MSKTDLKNKLTDIQYKVTQEDATEPPFQNEFWDHKQEGIYVDIVSGEVLFSSKDKFDSGCGWPSFTTPLKEKSIVELKDASLGTVRTEVRSSEGDSHLGHVFNDGPGANGLRYCINSASLRFISINDLDKEGHSEYQSLFKTNKHDEVATFGAGCFWGVEHIFSKLTGVKDVISGYCGGELDNPTYEDICTGTSGHAEVVQVYFDNRIIGYKDLLGIFWRMHDPTTPNQQGPNLGTQYRSTIFFHDESQRQVAELSQKDFDASKAFVNPSITKITEIENFFLAEDYHQDYYDKKYQGQAGPICHILRDK